MAKFLMFINVYNFIENNINQNDFNKFNKSISKDKKYYNQLIFLVVFIIIFVNFNFCNIMEDNFFF